MFLCEVVAGATRDGTLHQGFVLRHSPNPFVQSRESALLPQFLGSVLVGQRHA